MAFTNYKLLATNNKNRLISNQLQDELKRLERDQTTELRMLNNRKQRFLNHSQKNYEINKPAEIKMYHTHYPGFCYNRTGEQRNLRSVKDEGPCVDLDCLHCLLFTNGEIDISKLLILHLLAIHDVHLMKLPQEIKNPKSKALYYNSAPMEQLIERSKQYKDYDLKSISFPIYLIDYAGSPEYKIIKDDRVKKHLLINIKVVYLIQSVVNTLEASNYQKFLLLKDLASDINRLKQILSEEHADNFLKLLMKEPIVTNISSFVLIPKIERLVIWLYIHTQTAELEKVLKSIHENVLIEKLAKWEPTLLSDNEDDDNFDIDLNLEPVQEVKTVAYKVEKPSLNPKMDLIKQYGMEKKKFMPKENPFEEKRKILREVEEHLNKAEEKAEEEKRATESVKQAKPKLRIREANCLACREKWRRPLPAPRRVIYDKKECEHIPANTKSLMELQFLIKEEEYNLNSVYRKFENYSKPSVLPIKGAIREVMPHSKMMESPILRTRELDTIKQEIREKETKRKLQQFLK